MGIELKFHAFFISALNVGEWSDSHFSLSLREKSRVERFGDFRIILKVDPKDFNGVLNTFLDTILLETLIP